MNTEVCQKEHRYDEKFNVLPDDQSSPSRHKCCGCAYEQGLNDAKTGQIAEPKIDFWSVSQAGTQRHKDAIKAYELGYKEGLLVIQHG